MLLVFLFLAGVCVFYELSRLNVKIEGRNNSVLPNWGLATGYVEQLYGKVLNLQDFVHMRLPLSFSILLRPLPIGCFSRETTYLP